MVSVGQIRQAAGKVADDYTYGEDADGTQTEKLASDETFGTLAHACQRLWITRRYGDDVSEEVMEPAEAAMRELGEALEARAEELLDEEDGE